MVTIKGAYTVKPAGPTPTRIMFIPDNDQFVSINHIPGIYFYRSSSAVELPTTAVETLKESFSKALVIFYPLAGRLQWTNAGGRLELDCNAMGALFCEAEDPHSKVDDFGDFSSTLGEDGGSLVPSVDYKKPIHEMPLLVAQVTKFGCRGMCVGVAASHVLGDGSLLHFMTEWARISRGEHPENMPFLDRTILRPKESSGTAPPLQPRFDHSEFRPVPLLLGKSDSLEERRKETAVAVLKLTKEQVESLKMMANDGRRIMIRPFSTYEAVAGHIWKCACKARRHKKEQPTALRVVVDFRHRMEPRLPKWYFGNSVLPMMATATSGEIVSKPLSYASSKIRETVEKVSDEYVRSALDFLKNEPDLAKFRHQFHGGKDEGAFHGNPNMGITSWITLPLYGADFGWGKAVYMGPGRALGYDGKSVILHGGDGDGSLLVALRLQVAHLDIFKNFFYGDIYSSRILPSYL